jgi:hypothetical protein
MDKKKLKNFIFVICPILIGLLVGCSNVEKTTTISPVMHANSPLPSATIPSESKEEIVIPTSQPGLAEISGRLPKSYVESHAPHYFEVYLGEWIESTDPDYPLVGLDKSMAPRAILDVDTGKFFFYDVPSGVYGIALSFPLSPPVLIKDTDAGHTLRLEVEVDDHINLGLVEVE